MNSINSNFLKTSFYLQAKTSRTAVSKAFNIISKTLLVLCVYLVFGLLFQQVNASINNTGDFDPYQAQRGTVWLLPDNGIHLEALQMQTDVNYEVSGAIARASVRQQFINNGDLWAEGIYVFPLPEKAAVDKFRMIIGERIIEGQIKQRATARKIYEKARAGGQKTSLIEQQRPNIFSTSLANIAPGEKITIEFEYQQLLDFRNNQYSLRFPLVVGPRYHTISSSLSEPGNQPDNETSVYTETDLQRNTNNPARIHILLDAGVSLAELDSRYHEIDIKQTSETRYSISTIGQTISSDRDFELVWKPVITDSPQAFAFNEEASGSNYTMLALLPPDLAYLQQKLQARDVIFVLDISGSMAGTSINQAKASLLTALKDLSPLDRFNVIWFNNEAGSLFADSVPATDKYKNHATVLIQQLQANGGTEMLPALRLALAKQQEFSRFRQVIFLTDGNINNETELFQVIHRQLGNSRLFTIGIGSAPNSYFMRQAALVGRGTFTHIGNINEVQEKTASLLKKLETPALINIQLTVEPDTISATGPDEPAQHEYDIFPEIIPDLYAGDALTLFFSSHIIPQRITLKADYGNTEWQTSVQLRPAPESGIRIAWAREKIASLMNRHHHTASETERESVKTEITETALQHGLVSRYTSLVAVDVTPVNAGGLLYRERLKNNLPYGWKNTVDMNGLMLAKTAAGSTHNMLLAIILFITGLLVYRWKNHGLTNLQ